MLSLVAKGRDGLILMHSKGGPETMQKAPCYRDVIDEIHEFMSHQLLRISEAGIEKTRIVIDPGIGFGKTVQHNLTIIRRLNEFKDLGIPILLGPSRKSFIGSLLGELPPDERLEGTAAAIAIATMQGARIFRVHDVKSMKRVILVAEGIRRESGTDG
jgi:dihydropteroate synthase